MENKTYGIIYRAFLEDGRSYIGQTINSLKQRISEHKSATKYHKYHFQRALVLYGFDSFKWEILEYCNSREELNNSEIKWISFYNSIEAGFNLKKGGWNSEMTTEGRKKLSEDRKGEGNPMFGKISKMRGNKLPLEWKNKIKTKFQKGQTPWNKGLKEFRSKRLTDLQKSEIYELYDQGISIKIIALKYNILSNSVSRIIKNRNNNVYYLKKIQRYEIYNKIYKEYINGQSLKDLCLLYNCNINTVRAFIKREKKDKI